MPAIIVAALGVSLSTATVIFNVIVVADASALNQTPRDVAKRKAREIYNRNLQARLVRTQPKAELPHPLAQLMSV